MDFLSNPIFLCWLLTTIACLIVILAILGIIKFCKWVDVVNEYIWITSKADLNHINWRYEYLNRKLNLLIEEINRVKYTPYNEEGKGSINPSEADTE